MTRPTQQLQPPLQPFPWLHQWPLLRPYLAAVAAQPVAQPAKAAKAKEAAATAKVQPAKK